MNNANSKTAKLTNRVYNADRRLLQLMDAMQSELPVVIDSPFNRSNLLPITIKFPQYPVFPGRLVTRVDYKSPLVVSKRFVKPQIMGAMKKIKCIASTEPDRLVRKIFCVHTLGKVMLLITPSDNRSKTNETRNIHAYLIENQWHLGVTSLSAAESALFKRKQKPNNFALISSTAYIYLEDAFMNAPFKKSLFGVLALKSNEPIEIEYRGERHFLQYVSWANQKASSEDAKSSTNAANQIVQKSCERQTNIVEQQARQINEVKLHNEDNVEPIGKSPSNVVKEVPVLSGEVLQSIASNQDITSHETYKAPKYEQELKEILKTICSSQVERPSERQNSNIAEQQVNETSRPTKNLQINLTELQFKANIRQIEESPSNELNNSTIGQIADSNERTEHGSNDMRQLPKEEQNNANPKEMLVDDRIRQFMHTCFQKFIVTTHPNSINDKPNMVLSHTEAGDPNQVVPKKTKKVTFMDTPIVEGVKMDVGKKPIPLTFNKAHKEKLKQMQIDRRLEKEKLEQIQQVEARRAQNLKRRQLESQYNPPMTMSLYHRSICTCSRYSYQVPKNRKVKAPKISSDSQENRTLTSSNSTQEVNVQETIQVNEYTFLEQSTDDKISLGDEFALEESKPTEPTKSSLLYLLEEEIVEVDEDEQNGLRVLLSPQPLHVESVGCIVESTPEHFFPNSQSILTACSARFEQLLENPVAVPETFSQRARLVIQSKISNLDAKRAFLNLGSLVRRVNSRPIPHARHLLILFRLFAQLDVHLFVRPEFNWPGYDPTPTMPRYRIECFFFDDRTDFIASITVLCSQLKDLIDLIPAIASNLHYSQDAFDLTKVSPSIRNWLKKHCNGTVVNMIGEYLYYMIQRKSPLTAMPYVPTEHDVLGDDDAFLCRQQIGLLTFGEFKTNN